MSSENAQEAINNLTMAVQLAGEEDQTAMNIAVITEVIVNTSAILTQTGGNTAISLQQQVNVRILVAIGSVVWRAATHGYNSGSNFMFQAIQNLCAYIIKIDYFYAGKMP